MNWCSKNEVRRCRPLLGTFVEICASGPSDMDLLAAVNAAFGHIESIQRRMSVHDEGSELSRVNAEALLRPVKVSDETFEVLRCGLEIARASGGAFDFTVAPVLASWGFLPANLRRRAAGTWRDISLQRGNRVHFNRPLAIDLGGIAKGFAVDTAIAALRAHNVSSACVNAGGDLRVFGASESLIHLRHPVSARPIAQSICLRNAALATSSPCFTRQQWRGRRVSHLVNGESRGAFVEDVSVSVRAPECWLADALTKVVLNADTPTATCLLERHRAKAIVLTV